jgi:hypothetical protein
MRRLVDVDMDAFPLGQDCPVGFLKGGNKIHGNLNEGQLDLGVAGSALIALIVLCVLLFILTVVAAVYARRTAVAMRRFCEWRQKKAWLCKLSTELDFIQFKPINNR